MQITHQDVRELGWCNRGVRRWCQVHGLDFAEFLKNGVSSEWLLAQNDALATELVEQVKARHPERS